MKGDSLASRVAANIAYFLEAQGKTYGDLGWSYNYVCDVVHGHRKPSVRRIQEFADRLHVDVMELARERKP